MSTQTDNYNKMQERLMQASALLNVIHGGGIENFEESSSRIKDCYLWACCSLVEEAMELSSNLKLDLTPSEKSD